MGLEKSLENYVVGSRRGWALIRHYGIYDLQALTGILRSWFLSRMFLIADKEHTEKVTTAGKEFKVDMVGFRSVSDYVKFFIQVEIVITRNIDIMVEENGKKVKKQQGEMDIRVKAHIQKNYKNTFKSSKVHEFLRQVYEKFIVRPVLREYRKKLQKETESLLDEIKDNLELNKK